MDYAMFLRGVNVGGIKVESKRLVQVLQELGLDRVVTYLASGNVTFSTPADSRLQARIEQALSAAFAYDAHVLLYPRADLAAIVSGYPYADDPDHHRYAILCDSAERAADLAAQAVDEDVSASGSVVYWKCPKGSTLTTPFSKVLARRHYKAVTTTRNLSTIEKLVTAN